jgi:hypothetical protein
MDNYQYELIHVIEHSISNEQLNDKIHEEIFHWVEDQQVVR